MVPAAEKMCEALQGGLRKNMLKRLRIAAKLAVLVALAVALALTIGAQGHLHLQQLSGQASSNYYRNTVPMADLAEAIYVAQTIRERVLLHVIAPDAGKRSEHEAVIFELDERLMTIVDRFEATDITEAEAAAVDEARLAWQQYQNGRAQVLEASNAGDAARAQYLASEGAGGRYFQEAVAKLHGLIQISLSEGEAEVARIAADARAVTVEFSIINGVGIFVLLAVGLLIARGIARPLRAVVRQAQELAQGNLALTELKIDTRDEAGELAAAFNTMIAQLRALIGGVADLSQSVAASSGQLQQTTEQVAAAAQGVAQAVAQVAEGATNQAHGSEAAAETVRQLQAAIGGIAAGAQEQAVGVQQTADLAGESVTAAEGVAGRALRAASASKTAIDTARQGADVVDSTVAGMARIRGSVLTAADHIRALGGLGQQIGEITAVINEIADQTNLLALNAAIEAARAGEYGRGFAVVAEEVRHLAERAGASADEIATLIQSIQDGTRQAVAAMESGTAEVESGTALAADAGRALADILATVTEAARDVDLIAAAADEIADSSRKVAAAIDGVAAVTEQNTAAASEMAASSDEVSQAVADIASVSAESAAAAEEVSASVEEMNASAEEIAASARNLAEVAAALQQQVAAFRL